MATVQNGQQKQLTAQDRALLFTQSTRQNYQMLPRQTVSGERSTIAFTLPKVRLLSSILLEVEATATLTSSAAAIAKHRFAPYNILRRISLDMNNGFSPVIASGKELYLMDLVDEHGQILDPTSNPKSNTYIENVASAGGTDNKIKFTLPIQVSLNPRDPVGLILLQNEETNVTLTIDVDVLANAFELNAGNGDIVAFKDMTISAMVETYSIPPIPQGFPDISILKLIAGRNDVFNGGGAATVKLPVGTIYRKLILQFENEDGSPMVDDDFAGNIELVFNQADIPYSIKPSLLSSLNHNQLGRVLPDGCYIFDFSWNGIANLGSSKNYIDTERLTEFWIRFSPKNTGRVAIVTETLSRLRSE